MQLMLYILPTDYLRDSREALMNNFRTLASNSAGNNFPIGSEIQQYQWCTRTDEKKMYILMDTNPEIKENWKMVIDLNKTLSYNEDVAAKYSTLEHKHTQSDVTNFEHKHEKEDITDFKHSHIVEDLPRATKEGWGIMRVGAGLTVSDDNIVSSTSLMINAVKPNNGDFKVEFPSNSPEPHIYMYVTGAGWKQIFPAQWNASL